jgi:hypothetical protein
MLQVRLVPAELEQTVEQDIQTRQVLRVLAGVLD